MPGNIGWQGSLILLVLLVVFGPKRLPELGRSLGRGMREFKDSVPATARKTGDSRRRRTRSAAAPSPERRGLRRSPRARQSRLAARPS